MAANVRVVEVPTANDLDDAIRSWIVQGYELANKTASSATMVKRKEFSALWAVIGFLICVIPLLVYIIVYAASSDQVLEIRIRSNTAPDTTMELDRLQRLVEQGDLSPVEFDIAKRRLLGSEDSSGVGFFQPRPPGRYDNPPGRPPGPLGR